MNAFHPFRLVGNGPRHVEEARPVTPARTDCGPGLPVDTHWTRILYCDLLRDDPSGTPHACSTSAESETAAPRKQPALPRTRMSDRVSMVPADGAPRAADGVSKYSSGRRRLAQLRLWFAPAAVLLALQFALALAFGGLLLLAPLLDAKPNVAHPAVNSTTATATHAQD